MGFLHISLHEDKLPNNLRTRWVFPVCPCKHHKINLFTLIKTRQRMISSVTPLSSHITANRPTPL